MYNDEEFELINLNCEQHQNKREKIKKTLIKEFNNNYLKYKDEKIPYLTNEYNISISNKNNQILIGLTKKPLKIAVDLEDLNQKINIKAFESHLINQQEKKILNNLIKIGFEKNECLIIIWSIKETLFKLINKDFNPIEPIITEVKNNKFQIKFKNKKFNGKYSIQNKIISTIILN